MAACLTENFCTWGLPFSCRHSHSLWPFQKAFIAMSPNPEEAKLVALTHGKCYKCMHSSTDNRVKSDQILQALFSLEVDAHPYPLLDPLPAWAPSPHQFATRRNQLPYARLPCSAQALAPTKANQKYPLNRCIIWSKGVFLQQKSDHWMGRTSREMPLWLLQTWCCSLLTALPCTKHSPLYKC